jgi:hypothetical protein
VRGERPGGLDWSGPTLPDADWTAKKAWKGEEIPIDHAIEN